MQDNTVNTTTSNALNPQSETSTLNARDLLLAVGFALMLAWHYIVLFSPIIDSAQQLDVEHYGFQRQLVLYLSLAATFAVIGIVNNVHTMRRGRLKPQAATIYLGGAFAFGASAFSALAPDDNQVLMLASNALLGVSEAVLMFFWLNRFLTKHPDGLLRSFSLDMIAGGAIALVICMIQWPESTVVAIMLPALSTLILAYDLKCSKLDRAGENEPEHNGDIAAIQDDAKATAVGDEHTEEAVELDETETANPEEKALLPISRKQLNRMQYMLVSTGVYALAFGLLQGAFLRNGIAMLITNIPVVMIGIVLAGAIVYQVPESLGRGVSVDIMHRFSLLLFVLGAVGSAWFHLGDACVIVSQIAVLAGFNLFDFGVMAYGMNQRGAGLQAVRVLEGGRPIVYTSLTVGLAVSYLTLDVIPAPSTPFALIMVCGMSIVLVALTTVLPLYALEPLKAAQQDNAAGNDNALGKEPANMLELLANAAADAHTAKPEEKDALQEGWISPWRSSCNQIAKLYQLSPRETEIFLLIAKGRNAEHVQQKLVISTHTAKTHIANIYRKLEVHSQQELLDLIEAFRDADRRLAESEDEERE